MLLILEIKEKDIPDEEVNLNLKRLVKIQKRWLKN